MCLSKVTTKRPKIAKEDIVVYKGLSTGKLNEDLISHGMDINCTINGIPVVGKLSINGDSIYICHNDKRCIGASASDKLGYKYSWYVDSSCKFDPKLMPSYQTPYRSAPVDIGETYTSKLIWEKDAYGDKSVYVGLHSFAHLRDVENVIKVKCIIPKGSKYYEGKFVRNKSYASDTLTYVEIIN